MNIAHLCSQHDEEIPPNHAGNNDTTFLGDDGVFVRLGSSWKKKR